MTTHILKRRARGTLLASAGPILATLLAAMPAHAQTAPVSASGDIVVGNTQSSSAHNLATGDGSRAAVDIAGPTLSSVIDLSNNAFTAIARSNDAALSLAPPVLDATSPRVTTLGADPGMVAASGNLLIANRQATPGGSAQADQFALPYRISLGAVGASTVTLDANRSDAAARGNAVVTTLDADPTGGGAGIVSLQTATIPSGDDETYGVAARVRSGGVIDTGAIAGSAISLSGNQGTANAATNAADNLLTARLAATDAGTPDTGPGPVMMLAAPVADESVSARFAILNRQQSSTVVKARSGFLTDLADTGPAIRSTVDGSVIASSIASDDNTLDAEAKGNLAANRIALSGDLADTGDGAGAALVNDQSLSTSARVVSSTHGGVGVTIDGDLTGSTVSAKGNSFSATSVGNAASDNRLTVDGTVIGATPSATVTANGGYGDAAFRLDNRQDYGVAKVTTTPWGSALKVSVSGDVAGSTIATEGNALTGRTTGNSAVNAVALGGARFDASATLANRQSGSGNISTTIGSTADPAGATIATPKLIDGSVLTIAGNSVIGSATGNVADNSLSLNTASLAGDGARAMIGGTGFDYGATGALALLSTQTLGGPSNGNATPAITANVITRSAIDSPAAVRSTLTIDGNVDRADTTGNAITNRVNLAAAESTGAGIALSSTQYGQASLSASVGSTQAGPASLDGSALSITNNRTVATATINDADNAVTRSAAGRADSGSSSSAMANLLGAGSAEGGTILVNQQFATGSAAASAQSTVGGVGVGDLRNATIGVDGNVVAADSLGNRALNAVTASDGAALASSQTNMAQIDATATRTSVTGWPGSMTEASLTVTGNAGSAMARGNVAQNDVTITGRASPGSADAAIGGGDIAASGNAVLANAQSNYGAVTARAGDPVALNAGPVSGSSLTMSGNTLTAAAYGNVAANSLAMNGVVSRGTASLVNAQVNTGPVTATVDGGGYYARAGSVTTGTIGITGNQFSAVAMGNQASSAIASPR